MGCGPSKKDVAVHPESATDQTSELLPGTPDAPASTPEPGESSDQYLLAQVSSRLSGLSGRGRPNHLSPTHSDTHPLYTGTTPTYGTSPTGAAVQDENDPFQYGFRRPGEDQRMSPLSIDSDPFARLPALPAPPPSDRPFNPLHPLGGSSTNPLRACGTESQIEFFKMLDKRIEEGPEYVSDDDKSS